MNTMKEVIYEQNYAQSKDVILVADIGGTNSNFGIVDVSYEKPKLLISLHARSQEATSFIDLLQAVLNHVEHVYGFIMTTLSVAAAGVVSEHRDYCKPTNLSFVIDTHEIKQCTNLVHVVIANDFEVIGYGLDLINQKDIVLVNKGIARPLSNKAILGAGTGLGKCTLLWNKHMEHYLPVASEGGHADFAVHNQLEFELVEYIQKTEGWTCSVSWEDLLSGNGIQRIYQFFKMKNSNSKANGLFADHGPHPDEIFNSRYADEHCWNTFTLYSSIYARCAKNFALDALALAGIYIAGGIAAKNVQLFEQDCFMQEFVNCGKQQELLRHIPIYVITDYNISLYGAAAFLHYEQD